MSKFFVLNQSNQLMSPFAHGFKQMRPGENHYNSNLTTFNALPETEAKEFAEKLAIQCVGQSFHLVELKGTVAAKPPAVWSADDGDQPLTDPDA